MRAVKRNIQRLWSAAVRALCGAAVFCLAASLPTSCILHEDVISRETMEGEPFVTVELRLPGSPYSYALTEPNENFIRTLDVLVFREEEDDGKEYFVAHVTVEPSTISTDEDDETGSTKKCTVKVPVSSREKRQLVFIANAQEAVEEAIEEAGGEEAGGTPKETLLSGIVFDMEGNWPAENAETFVPFPMWGESSLLTLTKRTTRLNERIYMLRMAARVNIRVNDALKDDFKLHEAYLYNRYTQGRVVPGSNVLMIDPESSFKVKVNAPTIPTGALPVKEPDGDDRYTTDGGNLRSITQSIYLMENAATNKPLEATCFVVGGKYRDSNEMRYWRIPLPRKAGGSDFSEGFRTFLRNNSYDVVLQAINSVGHKTPGDAFLNSWEEVPAIVEWVESGQSSNTIGYYQLSVGKSRFDLPKDAQSDIALTVATTNPGGYSAEVTHGSDWLSITGNESFDGATGGINLLFSVERNTSDTFHPRVGQLCITAAGLKKCITVFQDAMGWEDVDIDSEESRQTHALRLILGQQSFVCTDVIATFSTTVTAVASASPGVEWTAESEDDWITVLAPSSGAADGTVQTLSFSLAPNTVVEVREGTVTVSLVDQGLTMMTTKIHVQQYPNPELVKEWEEVEGGGSLQLHTLKLILGQQSFTCTSGATTLSSTVTAVASASPGVQWKASASDNWITGFTPSSGAADGTAQTFSFNLAPNSTQATRNGTVTVSLVHQGTAVMTQEIHVRQYSDPMISFQPDASGYVTDQLQQQGFTLFSNRDWAVRLKNGGDPSGIFRTLHTTGGKANETGDRVWFALNSFSAAVPPPSGSSPYTFTLEIFSPKGEFNPVEVVITAGLMN